MDHYVRDYAGRDHMGLRGEGAGRFKAQLRWMDANGGFARYDELLTARNGGPMPTGCSLLRF